MGRDYHRLPANIFSALATGGGGPAAMELLRRSQYSKHMLLLHGIADACPAAYYLLAQAQRKDPAAVATLIRYPSVGAWAYRTSLALRGGPQFPGATPDGLANIAAAAAIRARLTAEIDVPTRDGAIMLPSLGVVEAPGTSMATMRITADGTQINTDGMCVTIPPDYCATTPGWLPLRTVLADLPGSFAIVVDDIDPFRMPAAPHVSSAPDLHQWRSTFTEAWTLLRRHHPEVAVEVATVITVAVPLVRPPKGQSSSSSPETFGAIALSEPLDPVDLAVTLAHEVQHMKLSAALDLVPLTRPDDGSRYYAPWREDPRPASGLLQGAYAYLGVTGFWRRQRDVPADEMTDVLVADAEFARWRKATMYVCEMLLASGQLTSDGERFVRTMAQTLRPWHDESVPDKAQRLADEETERHTARWQEQYGPTPRL